MVKRINFILLICLCSGWGFSQNVDHQRVGVEKETPWNLVLGAVSNMTYSGLVSGSDFYWSNQVSAQFTLNNSWFCGAGLPVAVNGAITEDETAFQAGLGDPALTLGWTGRLSDFRLTAAGRCSFPLGVWESEDDDTLITGSGRFYTGILLSLSTILDPVVLKADLTWDMGLPFQDRFGSLWYPGIIGLSGSISEVLNDRVGYRIAVHQQLMLPPVEEGVAKPGSLSYSASMEFEVYYSLEDFRFEVGVKKSLTSLLSPGTLTLSCSYSLEDGCW